MRFPLVVFDFDGTLADSLAQAVATFERLAPQLGLKPVPDLATARAMPTRQLLKTMGVRFWQLPRVVRAFQAEAARHTAELRLHAGIADLLRELHTRGHQLGVLSSNSAEAIQNCLRTNQVEELFTFVVGTPTLFGKAKALRAILRSRGVPAPQAVYVGDELRDIEAGRKARVATVAVTWGFHVESLLRAENPTWLIHQPAELLAAISD